MHQNDLKKNFNKERNKKISNFEKKKFLKQKNKQNFIKFS